MISNCYGREACPWNINHIKIWKIDHSTKIFILFFMREIYFKLSINNVKWLFPKINYSKFKICFNPFPYTIEFHVAQLNQRPIFNFKFISCLIKRAYLCFQRLS